MRNKKIIIIGASSGIGEGLAYQYAQKGCLVGITGRREDNLLKMKEKYPDHFIVSAFDVTCEGTETHLFELIKKIGGLDLLIVSAGVGYRNPEMDKQKEMITVQTNVLGFTKVILFGFVFFRQQGHGHLAGISSIAGIRGIDLCPAYSASKGYEALYLESLRRKSTKEKLGITVTTIMPGFVNTVMAQSEYVFWRSSVEKAASQIVQGLEKRRSKIYVTRRWRGIAWLFRRIPNFLFDRL